ncbi:toxin [Alloscardovia omnicolens]|uniref:toxin n=1 Tax=Alloscardovia omnicolens TaxID=419015 RepID=UPI00255090DB|nr:toxin [Alloscardovia omnicolens]MDK8650011.1 toxin [Alloscardovia omnicolens]
MNIFPSALKHGITPEQSVYVVEHALKIYELDNDPLKLLYLGADDKGTLLEVIATQTKYGHTIIHSMKMRTQYKKLLNTKRR